VSISPARPLQSDDDGEGSSRLQVFIVEDSAMILDNLSATLEEMAPVKVVGSACDEPTGMRRLLELEDGVDLVIIDIFLKVGSGLGLLRRLALRDHPAKRAVLTNYATLDMRQHCLALGADEMFDKSNELDGLIAYCIRLAAARDGPGA
jgi:DNA-binding NarL/FixJ family response regulator